MWKILKDLTCFSLLSFLKRIAKKVLGSFKRRSKSMINTTDSSESIFKENQNLLRKLSCPTISTNRSTQDLTNVDKDEDINTQEVKSISKSKKKRNRRRRKQNIQTPKEEDGNKELSSKVKSSISTALTIGLIGAKAASFFFAIKSLMVEENTEDIDDIDV
jgi:hypothetical protein